MKNKNLLNLNAILICIWTLASSNVLIAAAQFDFDDGTTQGWYKDGAYDEDGDGPFSSNFGFGWSDDINYPNASGKDLAGDNKGSAHIYTYGGHGISNPSVWWNMKLCSPDLSTQSDWQTAKGYTVEIAECMGGTTIYANLFVTVYDNDQAKDRLFYSGEAQILSHDIFNDDNAVWNHINFDWSGISTFPKHYIVKNICVKIWGKRNGAYEGRVCIDNVTAIDGGTAPTASITVTSPNGGETWQVGSTHNITWTGQDIDDYDVSIKYSTDGGSSYKPITYITNHGTAGSYTWTVPNEPSDNCLVQLAVNKTTMISDVSDAAFTITGNSQTNTLVNGDFSGGLRGWGIIAQQSATASVSAQNGEYCVSITNPGTENWHIQIYQSGLSVENGKHYQVAFDAYATSAAQINASVMKYADPWTTFSYYDAFSLTTTKQRYSFSFIMNESTSADGAVVFNVGKTSGSIYFDNVTFSEVTSSPALGIGPTILDFGKANADLTFQINNFGNGELTWNVNETPDKPWITAINPASGTNSATVTVSVDRTLLTGDMDIGTLSVTSNGGNQTVTISITSNSLTNTLVNGDFSYGLAGWDLMTQQSAIASGSVQSGEYCISIANPGTESWHIQINQFLSATQLNELEKHGLYELSFSSRAEVDGRKCLVSFEQDEDPWTSLLNETFIMSTSPSSNYYEFIIDTIFPKMKLSFQPGKENGSFTLDNVKLERKYKLFAVPGIVESEGYSAMDGLQTQETDDIGGGMNVGWIDAGDWMEYLIDVPAAETYAVSYRVAGISDGLVALAQNGEVLSTTNIPATGDWQTWTTIKTMVNLTKGIQTIQLIAISPGWNINWWKVEKDNTTVYEPSATDEITIFPNPASGFLNIVAEKGSMVKLYNCLGLPVQQVTLTGNRAVLDITGLPDGVYLVEISNGNGVTVRKVVVQ